LNGDKSYGARPSLSALSAVSTNVAGAAAKSGLASAECDPSAQSEPIASRFEIHGETVYDKKTDLTWMRCSYGQEWSDHGGCSGSVRFLDWDGNGDLEFS
jgi:hypothetical protein